MNRSLENTLTGLIPTLTGPIPRELIDLANSFLSLSRQRVCALRSEEESARAYLCAHIACERLKIPLDLPQIEPRPPLPKRQYSLLYTQFLNALSPGPGEGHGKAALASPTKRASRPTKTPGTSRWRDSTSALSSPRKAPPINGTTKDPIATLIHRICTHPTLVIPTKGEHPLPSETIIKHMLSCIHAIALSVPVSNLGDMLPAQVQDTIAAVYILTRAGLSGKDITGEAYSAVRASLCEALEEIHEAKVDFLPSSIDAAINNLMVDEKAVDWLRNLRASARSDNVPSSSLPLPNAVHDADENDISLAETGAELEQGRKNVPTPRSKSRVHNAARDHSGVAGIGRMLQDRVDYLGEKRRRLYQEWKEDVMKRVTEIESMEHGRMGKE